MGFFSKLFAKSEEPVRIFEHAVLGRSEWSEDDEAWAGVYYGFAYSLAYDGKATPSDELSRYAVEMLSNQQEFLDSVESAKARAVKEYSAFYTDEIGGLKLGLIHFSRYKNSGYILADLEGGFDYRAWRIEFRDHTCVGIGFDS